VSSSEAGNSGKFITCIGTRQPSSGTARAAELNAAAESVTSWNSSAMPRPAPASMSASRASGLA
jgi:hypothetical protein